MEIKSKFSQRFRKEQDMAGIKIEYPNDYVWTIVDKNSKYAMVMSKPIRDLTISDIEGIDIKGYYYSSEENANEALKQLNRF